MQTQTSPNVCINVYDMKHSFNRSKVSKIYRRGKCLTNRSEEHVPEHVAASEDEEGEADVHGAGLGVPEVGLEHGLQHPVAAEGGEEVHEREEEAQGGEQGTEPGNKDHETIC